MNVYKKIAVTTAFLVFVSTGAALADNPSFLNSLVASLTSKITALTTPNVQSAAGTLSDTTSQSEQDIQNFNNQYLQDISSTLSQFSSNYAAQKQNDLKNQVQAYESQMNAQKQQLIQNAETSIQQQIDAQYNKNLNKIESDLSK
jgi:exonuclease VII large subunit